MTPITREEISLMIAEGVRTGINESNRITHNRKPIKKKMEFSKKLMVGAFIFIGIAFIASWVSWVLIGDWPRDIAQFFVWPFIMGIVGYFCKSAYENKAKIQYSKEEV